MSQLRIEDIDRRNWERWSSPVLQTMERTFPKILCWENSDFDLMFRKNQYLARLAVINNEFVGLTFGIAQNKPRKGMGKLPRGARLIHLHYIFVHEKFRYQGYGLSMLKDFVEHAKTDGYSKLSVLAKLGPSLENMRKLGAREHGAIKNFYKTGGTYVLCSMDI